jgi:pyruvate dehydrogenase E1 component alpha subunit/2-oxoisovalerate dehydrogenase E1 component alpha subunit
MDPEPPKTGDPSLDLSRVLRDDGSADPACDPFLAPETLLAMYREMRKLRTLDAALVALQRQGRIGFYGACLGQEAVPIATAFAVEPSDLVFPALRESAVMLVRGFPLERYIAQVFGSSDDVLKGRQMPSHMSARAVNVVSWSSTVASQLPQAVGAAWAARKTGARSATVGFVGEGGTSSPDFHAAANFAAVFRAPCLIVCQNNAWALSTPANRQTVSETFAVKAKAYGMHGVRIDGNDVLAVYRTVAEARVRAVAGAGPTLIECVTYRMGPHSTSDDPDAYRSSEGVEEWKRRDPIVRLRRHLEYLGIMEAALDARMGNELDDEIKQAIAAAEAKPPPDRATMFDDVYAERPWHLEEQAREGEPRHADPTRVPGTGS